MRVIGSGFVRTGESREPPGFTPGAPVDPTFRFLEFRICLFNVRNPSGFPVRVAHRCDRCGCAVGQVPSSEPRGRLRGQPAIIPAAVHTAVLLSLQMRSRALPTHCSAHSDFIPGSILAYQLFESLQWKQRRHVERKPQLRQTGRENWHHFCCAVSMSKSRRRTYALLHRPCATGIGFPPIPDVDPKTLAARRRRPGTCVANRAFWTGGGAHDSPTRAS